ncbi:MAG: TIGR00725 family protein [Gemmatimonadetes bacterium]|nr:TIGR00725 family protein [Gemmatimonadota bacterium]
MTSDPDLPLRIGVIGGGRCSAEEASLAEAVGRRIAEAGAVVVSGGLGGVMEAAARGARGAGGLTVGILPGTEARDANPWIRVPLPTGMGEGRNILVVRAAEAIVAVGGEWGTLSEIALARKIGAPVIALGEPPVAGLDLEVASTADGAVEWALARARERRPGQRGLRGR